MNFQVLEKEANDETGEIHIKGIFRYAMHQYRDVIRKSLSKILDDYIIQSKSEVTLEYVKSMPYKVNGKIILSDV